MAECPNCGAAVEAGAPVCDSCGMSLSDDLGGEESGQSDGASGDDTQHDHQEGGHQHGGEPQQGGQPQQDQPRQGQPQGGQPQQGQPQGGQPQGGQHRQGQSRQGQPQGGQPRQGQPQGGQPRQGQPQGGQRGQPRQGQAPPQQGQPQQGQYRQPQQGQYRQPQDDEVVAGLNRRQVLGIGGAGVAVVAVGGFLLLGGGASGPAGTAEAFVNNLNNGDGQAAADLLHPDSRLGENEVTQLSTLFAQVDISIQGSEVTEQTDNRAEVEIQASAQGQTNTLRMEMRQANGEWRVFSFSGV